MQKLVDLFESEGKWILLNTEQSPIQLFLAVLWPFRKLDQIKLHFSNFFLFNISKVCHFDIVNNLDSM